MRLLPTVTSVSKSITTKVFPYAALNKDSLTQNEM